MTTAAEAVDALVEAAESLQCSVRFEAQAVVPIDLLESGPPIADDLRAWWSQAGPVDVVIPFRPDDLYLSGLADIWEGQVGYRWDAFDESRQLLPEWDPEWLVIGDIGGDPVIAHAREQRTTFSVAVHGAGRWAPKVIADDSVSFLLALAAWLRVLQAFEGEPLDDTDDLAPKPGFYDALRHELGAVIQPECIDNLVGYMTS